MIEILNCGAGVQSSTVMLMSCRGELPRLDHVIFSDPGRERKKTYEHLKFLRAEADKCGVNFHEISIGNIRDDALQSQKYGARNGANGRWGSMPYYVLNPNGTQAMVKRQCTSEYKIDPIEMFIKTEILGLKRTGRFPKEPVVRQWFGISADEWERMHYPRRRVRVKIGVNLWDKPVYQQQEVPVKWKVHYYPLMSLVLKGDKKRESVGKLQMTRTHCREWCTSRGYPIAPRSACIECPFHSDDEWSDMKANDPDEFEEACVFDEEMRDCAGMKGKLFLHKSCKPLRQVLFIVGSGPDVSQQECLGMCGV